MSPAGEKPRKTEPLQAVVQTGELGFYPLNSLAATALKFDQTRCLIGLREEPLAERLRTQSEFVVEAETLPIQGRVFAGICDAFYRGKLPEALVVTSNMLDVPLFIEEFMDFLEKLCALGFLSQQETDEIVILDRYVPQVVIASYGVVFDVILQKFAASIENLGGISPRQRERLLQKLSRGFFTSPEEGYDTHLAPITLYKKPVAFNLAGSKSLYTVRTAQVLENNHIKSQFNPNGEQGVLEWELHLAYKHLQNRLLPLLAKKKVKLPLTEDDLTRQMESLGQYFNILPGMITTAEGPAATLKHADLQITTMDLAILHQLKILAKRAQLLEFTPMLDTLLEMVKPFINPVSAVAGGEKR